MTAVSDETGREALQSPQHIIEGIILRRLHDERIEGYTLEMSKEIAAALSAAPVGEPVQDTWFTDRALPVVAMSGDIESERVLKLHFRRKVTEQDRIDLTDALNLKIKSATNPSASPVAQEPVAIKPLKWEKAVDTLRYESEGQIGDRYTIFSAWWGAQSAWGWVGNGEFHHTEVDAMAACQSDYQDRIRSALASPPPATPAGLGAEIAAVFDGWLERYEHGPPIQFTTAREYAADAVRDCRDAILALLSRGSGSDQQRRHEEQSTQNI